MIRRLVDVYAWLAVLTARRGGLVTNALFISLVIAMITATLAFLWQAALADGDFAGYGEAQADLEAALRRAQEAEARLTGEDGGQPA